MTVSVLLRCRWTSPLRAWKQSLTPAIPFFHLYAAKRLGWFGPAAAQAVPALVEALNVEYLRLEAIEALGKIGPPARAAIPALVALQNEALVGIYAKDALSTIRGN